MLRREIGIQKPLLTRDILFVFEDNIWLYRYIQEEQKLYLSDASFEEFRCGPSVTFDAFGDPAPGISRDVSKSSLTFFVLGRDVDTVTWCGSDGPRFIAPEMLHWPTFGASCALRSPITAPLFLNRRHQSGTNASGFASTIKPSVKYVLVARGGGPAMIGFMSVEAQAEVDFDRARRRAFYGRVAARLRRECSRLLAFEEVAEGHLAHNRRRLGLRDVEVSKIIGSVGRTAAFDRGFMPTKASLEERWKRVDRAFHRGLDLPAVRLFKMGDSYFVEDGNHRVSVARYQGVETIEAEVTEVFPPYLAHVGRAA